MVKDESPQCVFRHRQLACGLIVLAVTAFSAVSISHLLHRCQPCQNSKIALDHQETTPNSEQQPQPQQQVQPDPLEQLPDVEQDLFHKVLETNYTAIWMGPPEINLVLRYIHGKETYLEWGSGGSTVNFPRWVKKAVSIEHDESWCSQMKTRIATDEALHHIDYRCVPVHRGTGGWGTKSPFEEGTYMVFKKYVDEIENTGVDLFDFVLIDGRSRVDCAIKALSYIKNDSLVVLHDASRVWGRGVYSGVEKYYTFVNFVGGHGKQGIVIMKRKGQFANLQGDHQAVQQILYLKYPELVPDESLMNKTIPNGKDTTGEGKEAGM